MAVRNSQAIDVAITAAGSTVSSDFTNQFLHQLKLPLPPARLAQVYNVTVAERFADFQRLVGNFSAAAQFPLVLSELNSTFTSSLARLQAANIESITREAADAVAAVVAAFDNTTAKWLVDPPYPSLVLRSMLEELEAQSLNKFNLTLSLFLDTQPCQAAFIALRGDTQRRFVDLLGTNARAITAMLEGLRKRLKTHAEATAASLPLPMLEAELRATLTDLKSSKLSEFALTVDAYRDESGTATQGSVLSNDLTAIENAVIGENVQQQQRLFEAQFARYSEAYRIHLQTLVLKECSPEKVMEEEANARKLGLLELSKIEHFRGEKHYAAYSEQAEHAILQVFEQVVHDVNQHVQRFILNEATRIVQNFRIQMDNQGLDKVPRNFAFVNDTLRQLAERSIEDFKGATHVFVTQQDTLPAAIFRASVDSGLAKLRELLADLQTNYRILNEDSMKRLTSSVRLATLSQLEKGLDMSFWSQSDFNEWLYNSVSVEMMDQVKKDQLLDELMRRENINAPELVAAVVSRDDPLGERDGSVNSPELMRKIQDMRSQIDRRSTLVNLGLSLAVVGLVAFLLRTNKRPATAIPAS